MSTTTYWALELHGDIEPEMHGPFKQARHRDRAAQKLCDQDPEKENGIFAVDVTNGIPDIYSSSNFGHNDPEDES